MDNSLEMNSYSSKWIIQRITAVLLIPLTFWFVYQFLSVLKSTGEGGGVAFWAHIGGFIAGILIIFLLRKKKIDSIDKGPWG